jgi:anti-anti-sigma regulatory factor
MSSRGLRALTMAKQEGIGAGVSIRLAAPNDVMREILAISRYDRLFAVDPTAPGNGA